MKKKIMIVFLAAVSFFQLAFPIGVIAYENRFMDAVVENGGKYSLDFSRVIYINKEYMYIDTEELYRVENRNPEAYKEDGLLGSYNEVSIENGKDGKVRFFNAEGLNREINDCNRFQYNYNLFYLYFSDYEFVSTDYGMKELVETAVLHTEDQENTVTGFEQFMSPPEGFNNGIYHIPLDGRITLCVYNGYAVISELYVGDKLVLRRK